MLGASLALVVLGKKSGLVRSKTRAWTFNLFFALVWSLYYKFSVVENGVAKYQRTYWNSHIVEKAALTRTRFKPCFWLFNTHAQTIICFALSHLEWPLSGKLNIHRENVVSFDGSIQHVDWISTNSFLHSSDESDSPILFLVHGLGDDTGTPLI